MSKDTPFAAAPKLAFGVLVLIFGAMLLGDNLRLFDHHELFPYFWPFAGLLMAAAFALTRCYWWTAAFALFAAIATARLFDVRFAYRIDVGDLFWPSILIFVGIHLVRRSLSGAHAKLAGIETEEGATVANFAFMAGNTVNNTSQSFRGGDVSVFMGGCELDLTGARTPPDGAVLDVFAMWGGVEIRVPKGWSVHSKVVPFLGAFEDKTGSPADPGAATGTLTVRGFVIMGGIEVNHGHASTAQ